MARTSVGYDAFISYSHALDGKLVPALQTMVERFAKPWYRPRALRIFRDTASLSANPDLWSSIETALAGSSWLVLMASPEAARSVWVDREIAWWLKHKAADRVLIALTGGRLAVVGPDGIPSDAALPPTLAAASTTEPRWVDLRWLRDAAHVDESNPRLRECVADLASTIRGTPKDLLVGEHIRQHRRAIRLARAAVTGLVLLTVAAVVAAFVAAGQRNNAVFNQILTRAEQLQAVDVSLAAQLSALAYQKSATPEAYTALVPRANQARSTLLTGHSGRVRAVSSDPAARWLASGSEDFTIRLWNPADRATVAVIELDGTAVNSFATPADGRLLIAGLTDGTVRIWDLADVRAPRLVGEPFRSKSVEPVVAVALSPDGRTLAAANGSSELRMWDITDVKQPRLGPVVLPGYRGVAFSSDGHLLAAGSRDDDSVVLFDASEPLRPMQLGKAVMGKEGDYVNSVAISPDGRTLVSGGTDAKTQLWNITDPTRSTIIGSFVSAGNTVTSVGISGDGSTLAVASADALIQLANITDPKHPLHLNGAGQLNTPGNFVLQIALAADGRHLVSGHSDGTVRYWELPQEYVGNADRVQSVQFSPDGRTLAAAGYDRLIRIWKLDRPTTPVLLRGHTGTVWRVRFSPDGRLVASASEDGTVRLWDLRDAAAAPRTILAGEEVWDVAFSPDGRLLATVGAAVRLWSLAEPQPTAETLEGATSLAKTVAFTPDGRSLAAGHDDGSIRIWEIARPRQPPRELVGHTETVTELEISRDGRHLASTGSDQTVRLWNISDPAESAPASSVLRGHTNTVYGLSFSPDGKRLASGGLDHSVRLWNLDDVDSPTNFGEALLLGPPPGSSNADESTVIALDYAPDGRSLAITGSDRTVYVWDLDAQTLVDRVCRTAAGNLSEQTWRQYFRDQAYQRLQCR
jgi:WD40 repeat protein